MPHILHDSGAVWEVIHEKYVTITRLWQSHTLYGLHPPSVCEVISMLLHFLVLVNSLQPSLFISLSMSSHL